MIIAKVIATSLFIDLIKKTILIVKIKVYIKLILIEEIQLILIYLQNNYTENI